MDCFMEQLRAYLTAMSAGKLQQKITVVLIPPGMTLAPLFNWHSESRKFLPLAQRLLVEIPKICNEMELVCWECPCRMFTAVNVLDHLVDDQHVAKMMMLGNDSRYLAESVQRMLGKLWNLLKRTAPGIRERELMEKGFGTYLDMMGSPLLRPTNEFVWAKLEEYKALACAGDSRAMTLANVGDELKPADDEYLMRVIRRWFSVEANRQRFMKEFDEHISSGVAHCEDCEVAYESKDDFYKHVTSYLHANLNQRMFGGIFLRLARGTQDWNVTM